MNRQKSFEKNQQYGVLYLVPTPIGNLEDMTFRAVNTLKTVSIIASEDTRVTQKLLNHYTIPTHQISFHAHNFREKIPFIIDKLLSGESIAQVSDAGMPSISDPGYELVSAARLQNITVVALPGATAGVTALVASGLSPQPYLFYGFLPRKKKEAIEVLDGLKAEKGTLIFYESPYRLSATFSVFLEVFGAERRAVIARELTKIHEEYIQGTVAEISSLVSEETLKGECVILVCGAKIEESDNSEELNLTIEEHVKLMMEEDDLTQKEAIKLVAKRRGVKKQEIYREIHFS